MNVYFGDDHTIFMFFHGKWKCLINNSRRVYNLFSFWPKKQYFCCCMHRWYLSLKFHFIHIFIYFKKFSLSSPSLDNYVSLSSSWIQLWLRVTLWVLRVTHSLNWCGCANLRAKGVEKWIMDFFILFRQHTNNF